MPRESTAVRALKSALAQATTPTEKAEIATKLARTQHQQGIERGRRRRARVAKPVPPQQKVNDDDELFEIATAQTQPLEQERLSPRDLAEMTGAPLPPEEDEREVHELEQAYRQHGDGSTRVISAMNFPGATYWDPTRGGYYEDINPQSSIGPQGDWVPIADDHVATDTWTAETGFKSEHDAKKAEEEETHWQNIRDKLYGR